MKIDFLHGNIILGFVSVLVGIAILGLTKYQNLLFIQEEKMGPGFFPIICGVAIVVCGNLILLATYKKNASIKNTADEEKEIFNKEELKNLILFSGLGIGVVILSNYIGLLPCLGLSILTYLRIQGKEPWKKAILVSLCMVIFLYSVFVAFLKVPVPKGIIMKLL